MTDIQKSSIKIDKIPIISMGTVLKQDEDLAKRKAGIIKVRLFNDSRQTDSEIVNCVPLLPRFLSVLPQENEIVFIFNQTHQKQAKEAQQNTQRYWIGPIISQDTFLEKDDGIHARNITSDGWMNLDPPNAETGAYGDINKGDVVLQGRNNTDIVQKDKEIWIRAGKFSANNNTEFNRRDIGYMQLKYGQSTLKRETVQREIVTYKYETPNLLINAQINTYVDNPPNQLSNVFTNTIIDGLTGPSGLLNNFGNIDPATITQLTNQITSLGGLETELGNILTSQLGGLPDSNLNTLLSNNITNIILNTTLPGSGALLSTVLNNQNVQDLISGGISNLIPPGLAGNLPTSSYKLPDITKTSVFIVVNENTQLKKEVGVPFSQEYTADPGANNSRDKALEGAINFIDSVKGDKWKITSNSNEILENYGKDPNNKIINFALFQSSPTEVKKTIEENKLVLQNTDTKSSVLNMVANKINLISHDGEHNFNLSDPEALITDDEQVKINSKAHPLVYGDTLVEFLQLVKTFVALHVHPYHGVPPDPSPIKTDVLNFDLQTILNKNINSN